MAGFNGPDPQPRGLAEGALLAAHWIAGRRGFYDFRDVSDGLLQAGFMIGRMPID